MKLTLRIVAGITLSILAYAIWRPTLPTQARRTQ